MKLDNEKAKESAVRLHEYFEGLIKSMKKSSLINDLEFNEGFRITSLWIEAINHFENKEYFLFESKKKEIIASFDNNSFDGSGWFELKVLAKNWLKNSDNKI